MKKSKKKKWKSKHRVKRYKKAKRKLISEHQKGLKFGTFFGTFEEFLIAVIAINVFNKKKNKKSKKNGKRK